MAMTEALGGLGGSIGGTIGFFAGSGDREAATKAYQEASDNFKNLDPKVQAQLAQAGVQGSGDANNKAAQLDALSRLRGVYNSNGLDANARASINQAQTSNASQAQALNSQMDNQMEQRGTADSGASYAHARANAVNAANADNQAGMNALAMGQNNRMAAIQGAGQLAGQIRQGDDAISRFNASNQTNNNQFNANQQQTAQQSTFNNGLARAGGAQGALNNQAKNWNGQAQAWQGMGAGIGQGIGATAGAGIDSNNSMMQSGISALGSGGGAALAAFA